MRGTFASHLGREIGSAELYVRTTRLRIQRMAKLKNVPENKCDEGKFPPRKNLLEIEPGAEGLAPGMSDGKMAEDFC